MTSHSNFAASIESGLLARKGEARPAMRRQPLADPLSAEDLGWNDMGIEAMPLASPLSPMASDRVGGDTRTRKPAGGRIAFTLRLDAAHHGRLRHASRIEGRSAQRIVIDALDRYLSEIPDVEMVARPCQIRTPITRGE